MASLLHLAVPAITAYETGDLAISALGPIILAFVGYYISKAAKRIDHIQWTNQKILEHRLELLQKMAPLANCIYCYFTWRGRWREHSPADITGFRRELADTLYTNAYLFSEDLALRYKEFEDSCFLLFGGANSDARLRTAKSRPGGDNRKTSYRGKGEWSNEWDKMFVPRKGDIRSQSEVTDAYNQLVLAFRRNLGQLEDEHPSRRHRDKIDLKSKLAAQLRVRPHRASEAS